MKIVGDGCLVVDQKRLGEFLREQGVSERGLDSLRIEIVHRLSGYRRFSLGLYNPSNRTISICTWRTGSSAIPANEILLHEICHFLDDVQDRGPCWRDMEQHDAMIAPIGLLLLALGKGNCWWWRLLWAGSWLLLLADVSYLLYPWEMRARAFARLHRKLVFVSRRSGDASSLLF